MSFPTSDEFDLNDQDLLQKFIGAVYDLLKEVIENKNDPKGNPLFAKELIKPMSNAFEEMKMYFDQLSTATKEIPPEQIFQHALAGPQLLFKLSVVSYRERMYLRFGGFYRFQWLLDALEGLLDSIIDASGVGGAIKEFKEAVRNSGKDTN